MPWPPRGSPDRPAPAASASPFTSPPATKTPTSPPASCGGTSPAAQSVQVPHLRGACRRRDRPGRVAARRTLAPATREAHHEHPAPSQSTPQRDRLLSAERDSEQASGGDRASPQDVRNAGRGRRRLVLGRRRRDLRHPRPERRWQDHHGRVTLAAAGVTALAITLLASGCTTARTPAAGTA